MHRHEQTWIVIDVCVTVIQLSLSTSFGGLFFVKVNPYVSTNYVFVNYSVQSTTYFFTVYILKDMANTIPVFYLYG
jgi:hypothetical protein